MNGNRPEDHNERYTLIKFKVSEGFILSLKFRFVESNAILITLPVILM